VPNFMPTQIGQIRSQRVISLTPLLPIRRLITQVKYTGHHNGIGLPETPMDCIAVKSLEHPT